MTRDDAASVAFSRQAPVFDAIDQANPIVGWIRAHVHHLHDTFIHPGDHVLEVTGGTGIDAVRMALRGVRVTATDNAPGMVAAMEHNVSVHGMQNMVRVRRLDVHDLTDLGDARFDHVTSNFGGLNCSDRLPDVVRELARHVRPGGTLTLVVMPPWCVWELASVLTRGWTSATRRLRGGGTDSNVEGVTFPSWYYTPRQLMRGVADLCDVVICRPLGLFCPPPHHGPRAVRHPAPYRLLMRLDDTVARWRWQAPLADHYVLVMRRR